MGRKSNDVYSQFKQRNNNMTKVKKQDRQEFFLDLYETGYSFVDITTFIKAKFNLKQTLKQNKKKFIELIGFEIVDKN